MRKEISKSVSDLSDLHKNVSITHWIEELKVKCHLFTVIVKSVEELKNLWEPLADEIAVYFQAGLENEYESWNLYVVFISHIEIPKQLKYEIQNDKYSSRKIVLDNVSSELSENEIIKQLSQRLFLLDIDFNASVDLPKRELTQVIEPGIYAEIGNVDLVGTKKVSMVSKRRIFDRLFKEYLNEI